MSCRISGLQSGEGGHCRKSPCPDTCLSRCVACVNYGEFFLKSDNDRKLSRKEEKKSSIFEPPRANAFGGTRYVHVLFVYIKSYIYFFLIFVLVVSLEHLSVLHVTLYHS